MMCPYLLISINELLISIIPFIDINKYGLNVKTAAHTSVDTPQAFGEDKDGGLQCLCYQHIAVWQRDMDCKETWNILNAIINKRQKDSSYPECFEINGSKFTTKNDIANGFNIFFANIGKELAAKRDTPLSGTSIHDYLDNKNAQSMFLSPVTEEEVVSIVRTCNSKTSTDSNGISMVILKKTKQSITKPLTTIFNMSFESGIFPNSMKISKIIPIFKSGSNVEFNNYRPISLLCQFSKILEKLYNKRLEKCIDKNNMLLSTSKYGFRRSMSTSHALIDLVEVDFVAVCPPHMH